MSRPEYDDSNDDDASNDVESDQTQSSLGYAQFGALDGETLGLIQEGGTAFFVRDEGESDGQA